MDLKHNFKPKNSFIVHQVKFKINFVKKNVSSILLINSKRKTFRTELYSRKKIVFKMKLAIFFLLFSAHSWCFGSQCMTGLEYSIDGDLYGQEPAIQAEDCESGQCFIGEGSFNVGAEIC